MSTSTRALLYAVVIAAIVILTTLVLPVRAAIALLTLGEMAIFATFAGFLDDWIFGPGEEQ